MYAELLPERDGDASVYVVESEVGADIRKRLFMTLAEKGWAMIGLEALGMSLEDVFINIVDDSVNVTEGKEARGRRKYDYESRKAADEREVARQIIANASSKTDE